LLRLKEWMLEAGRSSVLGALRLTTLAGRIVGQGSVSTQTGNTDAPLQLERECLSMSIESGRCSKSCRFQESKNTARHV
jgi:hypothetical protein